jgi:hypothetical protein
MRRATGPVLDLRTLNRTLLARQHLLARQSAPAADMIEHLVGMQAQVPGDPYVGLSSRLETFDPEELSGLIADRAAVRATMFRATIHLVTARDAIALRPVLQPVLERVFNTNSPFGRRLAGVDVEAVLARGRELISERPRTRAELGRLLHEHWPDRDAEALGQAMTYLPPLVQVPPRGLWGRSGRPTWASMEAWLGRPLGDDRSPDAMLVRYLAAFGPAGARDARAWSGLVGLTEVFERLRPRLRTFQDEDGRELFDVPDGTIADPDTPAPVRFLPEYDNVGLSHADRARIVAAEDRRRLLAANQVGLGSILVDGFGAASWRLVRARGSATLAIEPYGTLSKADASAVADEGERLIAFLAPGAERREVRLGAGETG